MTRANTEQSRLTPWFAKAGAACSIVPISRFVSRTAFALKGGGYSPLILCPRPLSSSLHRPVSIKLFGVSTDSTW
jgi:hypothetical protein